MRMTPYAHRALRVYWGWQELGLSDSQAFKMTGCSLSGCKAIEKQYQAERVVIKRWQLANDQALAADGNQNL